ncbi:hypothetical protein EGW08_017928, partial [Elysia chlorotica]
QFPLPHSRGSSHGQTRITRRAYTDAFYTRMMDVCSRYWSELRDATGSHIFRPVGYLAIGTVGGEFLNENIHCMAVNQAPYKLLSPEEFRLKYPMLRYGDNVGGLLDMEGGVLMADKALLAMQKCNTNTNKSRKKNTYRPNPPQKSFTSHGGTLRDGETMKRVVPGEVVTVHTDKGSYRGKALILCCGPWTNQVLAHLNIRLPLKVISSYSTNLPFILFMTSWLFRCQPIRISVCYWRERTRDSHSPSQLPTFFDHQCCGGHSIYGIPSLEYPGHVKLCLHNGPAIDAELRDTADSSHEQKLLEDYVRKHFPGLEHKPSIVESCIYTMTPDTHPVLDRHPTWNN